MVSSSDVVEGPRHVRQLTNDRRRLYQERFAGVRPGPELLDEARLSGDQDLVVQVLITYGVIAYICGDYVDAAEFCQAAEARLATVRPECWPDEEQKLLVGLYNTNGLLEERRGQRAAAAEWMTMAFEVAMKHGERPTAARAWANVSGCEIDEGNLLRAVGLFQRLLSWPSRVGQFEGAPHQGLARVALVDGDLAGARQMIERSIELDAGDFQWHRQRGRLILAETEVDAGRYDLAESVLNDPILDDAGGHADELVYLRCRLALRTGQLDLADQLSAEMERSSSGEFGRRALGVAVLARAELDQAHGNAAKALERLDNIDDLTTPFVTMLNVVELKSRLHAESGRHAEAAMHLDLLRSMRVRSRRPMGDLAHSSASDVPDGAIKSLETAYETLRAEELRDLFRQRRELVGIVAHDLRGALTTCRFARPMLSSSETTPQDRKQAIEAISTSVDAMRSVVDVLSQLLAIEENPQSHTPRTLEVEAVVEDAVAVAQLQARRKSQEIQLTSHLREPSTVMDSDIITIIVSNLLSNAVKYSPLGAPISVSLDRERDQLGVAWISISVQDQGPGMTDAERELAWQRYTRTSATPTGSETSLGLGLYIARELSDRIGATTTVASDGPGQGSTFTLRIRDRIR